MYLFLAFVSTFGYALQSSLMAKFSRKGDSMSMSVYRSLSLGISLLPLLFFTSAEHISKIGSYQFELIISSFCIVLNIWAFFEGFKSLPVGIANGFRSFATVLSVVGISWILFGEKLGGLVLVFILLIIIGGVILSVFKTDFTHLDNSNFFKGVILSFFSGILSAVALVMMIKVSRELDPFVSSYFWELEAGFIGIILLYIRKKFFSGKIDKINLKDFRNILISASPTLLGTGGYALASTMGSAGVISAIGVFGMVFTVIFGVLFFKEHLKTIQYIGILIIVIGIFGIKVFG